MTSVCISRCVNDARDPRIPARATYVNLHKWPESDPEFIRSVRRVTRGLPVDEDGNNNNHGHSRHHQHGARVVDCISCRQMYLRSYTFSRKESPPERPTRKPSNRKSKKGVHINGSSSSSSRNSTRRRTRKKCFVLRRAKEVSCNAMIRVFHRLLSCSASVDVVD